MVWLVEVRVSFARRLGGVAVCALFGFLACAIERTPQESLDLASHPVSGRIPQRTPNTRLSEDQFGPQPAQNWMSGPNQVGGLQCAGVYCPFAPEPIEPCCTTAEDVERGAARLIGRCGFDFGRTSGNTFSTACWQRDQLGVLDGACPPVETQPGFAEPGCCSDTGVCGSVNTSYGLGCHYELDGEPTTCGEDEIVGAVQCDPLGVFGVRSEVDVTWGRSGGLAELVNHGRNKIVVHLKVVVDGIEPNGEVHGVIQPCGVELPPFYSEILCESYLPQFPVSIWESGALPEIELSGRWSCLNPGCNMTLDAQTSLLGIDLPNPEAPWPSSAETATITCSSGAGVACFPDHDADGLPGLTVTVQTSGRAPPDEGCGGIYRYRGAPLSANLGAILGSVRRTDRILLGTRIKLGGTGRIAPDCNSGVGAGLAEFVQSRAWGCLVQQGTFNIGDMDAAGPNDPCPAPEAQFMDDNLPIYHVLGTGNVPDSSLSVRDRSPSEGPKFGMVRLGSLHDAVGCEAVRAAAYP
jgi:hypothetical protein